MAQTGDVALVIMDLQNDVVHPEGLFGKAGLAAIATKKGVLENTRAVLDRARAAGIRVIHVAHGYRPGHPEVGSGFAIFDQIKASNGMIIGTWGAQFHELVAPVDDEAVVSKSRVSSFFQSDLELLLRLNGIRTVVALGMATNMVVEATVREAADMGFTAIVLEDCCASFDPEEDEFSLKRILPKFARVTNSSAFFEEAGL